MKKFAIIVAGGSGSRMKSELPKQFIAVNRLPILMHTLQAFHSYSSQVTLILVLPAAHLDFWKSLCVQHSFLLSHRLVAGGETRFHSVKNGLAAIDDSQGLVAVHDGVRPVISAEIISQGYITAERAGTAVTSVPLKDSIRMVKSEGGNQALDRSNFLLIQTPQTFRLDWMRNAFAQPYQQHYTDCASVLEAAGHCIELIPGAYENIKITTPEDLEWASVFLK
ncbi:2-C-methyl-D-erythritol 4-phosphate cytidylyltransferase [Dyadobacter tibetensis]|uniref:2-C-methyl-D-erythritol 4-phosphate cytidylyltransferase n=1 Tax=Dyadobacter tibetensis TaxID=1211851 RepID=UPI00047266FD|nr:2-C-methyl-D-erythritol 4-phosphate cytidylyltransferase [Dyadobacter tibetensis]